MNRCQAFRIAIRALEYQRARYKIDANLAEKYGADYPAAQAALAKVQELNSAISILNSEIEAQAMYPSRSITPAR